MSADLQILTKTYDLSLWTLGHTAKFPRSHRFSLGTRMEHKLCAGLPTRTLLRPQGLPHRISVRGGQETSFYPSSVATRRYAEAWDASPRERVNIQFGVAKRRQENTAHAAASRLSSLLISPVPGTRVPGYRMTPLRGFGLVYNNEVKRPPHNNGPPHNNES
jgi:hypothetical protein